MLLDGFDLSARNPAEIRRRIGVDSIEASLEDSINNLSIQIANLSAQINILQQQINSLQLNLVTANKINQFDVIDVDGEYVYDTVAVDHKYYQNLVIEAPEEGKLYRLQYAPVDGEDNWELLPADVLKGTDGRKWRLTVQFTDGVPNLSAPELVS